MAQKARKAPAAQRNLKPFYVALAVIAVIGIGAILYARSRGSEMVTEPLDLSQIADADALLRRAQGVSVGAENAPVQVMVFSDFMCPGCGHWTNNIEPSFKAEFVETGKVRYTYYDFPLPGHTHSFIASRAARCAGDQGKFWEYHDVLFARQAEWSYPQQTPLNQLLQYGTVVGLDRRAFDACVRSDQHAEVVTANKLLGDNIGVPGTPTVFINNRRLGEREWQNYESVKAAIQAAGGV